MKALLFFAFLSFLASAAMGQDRLRVSQLDINSGRWVEIDYNSRVAGSRYKDRLRETVLVEFPSNENGYLFLMIGTESGRPGRIRIYEAVERDGRIEKGLDHPVAQGERGPYEWETQEEASRGPGRVLAPLSISRFNWVKGLKLIITVDHADLVIRDLDVSG